MSVFDEDLVEVSMDKEVIKNANAKNAKYTNCIEGWVGHEEMMFTLMKGSGMRDIRRVERATTYHIVIRSRREVMNKVSFPFEISTLSKFFDRDGLVRFKINIPSLPVVIRSGADIPDCFILDVPAGTKEITFVSFFYYLFKKLPKVRGDVKITYINRPLTVNLKKGEKINIEKWWRGEYENRNI